MWREVAIEKIAQRCGQQHFGVVAGVVTGHFKFWDENEGAGHVVWTRGDMKRYTHIIYLDIDPEVIYTQRLEDTGRMRRHTTVEHLKKWQKTEKAELRQLCRDNDKLFISVAPIGLNLVYRVWQLLLDFRLHTEESNLSRAKNHLNDWVQGRHWRTILVLDADRTLTAEDTGRLFWKIASRRFPGVVSGIELVELFNSQLGYTYTAFRQAVLLYEEACSSDEFDQLCEEVASVVVMHPKFHWLLSWVKEHRRVGAVVITCGLRRIWEKIEKACLEDSARIIGGGRIEELYVITPEVKASLVHHLREIHKLHVWIFGDSPLD
ncbi:hypothetical protein SLS62_001029 [Diatrype stigma]|uniref:Uncharacterized protein n=1 Tax=Diatrype stigma TaxID=117547 RepID=A0AAN9VBE8_9PEZI